VSVDLTSKLAKLLDEFEGTHLRGITTRVATQAKAITTKAIDPTGLSNYGRGKRKGAGTVKARFDLIGNGHAVLKPAPPALAALLELGSYKSGTSWKSPKRRGSKRRKRGTVGSYTRGAVPARGAWSRGTAAAKPEVAGLVHEEVVRAVRKVY
jgi:hypothetical protein